MTSIKMLRNWLVLAVIGALSQLCGVSLAATSVTGGYTYSINQSGSLQNQTLNITISPDQSMVGNPGSVFVSAKLPNGAWYSYAPSSGWQQWNQNTPMPSYANTPRMPATITITPIQKMDVSPAVGTIIYAGYGLNSATMFSNNTYSAVYVEQPQTSRSGLTVCQNTKFALCASSTCTATGGTVTNNQGISFPAASCTCPIVTADNIADLSGGNQVGSCTSPDPSVIYSTYSLINSYPQFINGTWQVAPAAPSSGVCNAPYSYAQCWNWKCAVIPPQNGVALAQCTCPIQTPAQWVAGSSNNACQSLPVGVAVPATYDPTTTSN